MNDTKTDKNVDNSLDNAYQKGDFKKAKQLAEQILKTTSDDDPKNKHAHSVLRAIYADPAVSVSFGVTLFILLFLTLKYLL